MKRLNHILIFEAFSSKSISKTLSFVDKKVGNKSKDKFLNALKYIKNQYDYPIDKIEDKYIDYLSKKDAILIRNSEDVNNKFGIYCIKFWFSVEKGYLGFTGVGNDIYSFNTNKHENPLTFNEGEMKYLIDDDIIPNKGILEPIYNYNNLANLDTIILYVDNDDNIYNLVKATIWKEGNRLFAIQNRLDGTIPNHDGWEKYGKYTWGLGIIGKPARDHFKIHKYVEDDRPLRIKQDSITDSVFDYNLPIGQYGKLSSWYKEYYNNTDIIDESDFSLILYFDDMIKNTSESDLPSNKSSMRRDQKGGSTYLMDDEYIKNVNIERYISKLIKNIGITETELTLRNLQKVILMSLNGEFALIYCRSGFIHKVDKFINRLYTLMNSKDVDDINIAYNNCFNIYKEIYKESLYKKSKSKSNISKLLNYYSDNKDILLMINKVLEIGNKISDNISKYPVDNIVDLKIIYQKLRSIRVITNGDDDDFYLGPLEDAFSSIMDGSYESSIYYFSRINSDERLYKQTWKSIINIERYIDSLFK